MAGAPFKGVQMDSVQAQTERYSFCLMFFALVALINEKRSFHQLLVMLPLSPRTRKLADHLLAREFAGP